MTWRTLAEIEDREAMLEERLFKLVAKCRGARDDAANRKTREAVRDCIEWIARARFDGVGIRSIRRDMVLRGLHIQPWWQSMERGSERLAARRRT